tara:strand:+ start:2271 stop:3611 length:1341 start_codon:yes stop_codon:yes gene_type:complete
MKFISNSNDLSKFLEIPIIKNLPIKSFSIDTRTLKKNSLFIAIKGKNFDGNCFIDKAFKNGASLVLVDDRKYINSRNKKIIYVSNTILALKKIAENIVKTYDGNIIAITGSNGKTTTTNIIAGTLKSSSQTIKNYNNEIGMPLSLMSASLKSKNIVLEIGAGKPKDISYLSKIIKPNIGVITNIGSSHLEVLRNRDGVLRVKSELIPNIQKNGYLIVPNENKKHLNFWKRIRNDINIVTFGLNENADFFAHGIKRTSNQITFCIRSCFLKEDIQITTSMSGEHNICNILTSYAVSFCLGNNSNYFINALKKELIKDTRQIKSKWLNGSLLIDDTYNANPDSAKKSIDLLCNYKERKILVFGDMLELGRFRKNYHKKIGEYAKSNGIDIMLGFGDLTLNSTKSFGKNGIFFKKEEDLKKYLKENVRSKDVILIKGSRGMRMERFINV